MTQFGIVLHYGGQWSGNIYEGGEHEYVPIPRKPFSYEDLLKKVERHVTVDTNMFYHQIETLVQSPKAEMMRMKISDDDELEYLLNLVDIPTLYITISYRVGSSKPHGFMSLLNEIDNDVHAIEDGNLHDEPNNSNSGINSLEMYSPRRQHLLPSMDGVNEDVGGDLIHVEDEHVEQWVIPGAVYHASIPCEDIGESYYYKHDALSKDATFMDKEKMRIALGLYHMLNWVQYVVERSSKKRFNAVCKYKDQCRFRMRATACGSIWKICRWDAPHTCQLDLRHHAPPAMNSNVIAAFFAPILLNEGAILRPKDMQHQLLREYGIEVEYQLTLSARNQAISMVYGDPNKSFQLLPSYLYMVKKCNPDSIVDLETESDDRFKYCFMAFGACVTAFRSCCRPVIVVDATHLKGKYKGVMFVAVTMDGNDQVFPLAVGIGDKENDSSWTWFFRRIHQAFGIPDQLLFVSDQHRSIKIF